MCSSYVQDWRDEVPFMYATPPNGRVGVGVDERGPESAFAFESDPEEDRVGWAGRGTGATGVCG